MTAATTAERDATAGLGPATRRTPRFWLVVAVVVFALSVVASIAIGARAVSIGDIWSGLTGSTDGFAHAAVAKRIPRTALAALAGAALAVSGLYLQGVTRNPLADPGILGINSGAALAVVIGIAWGGLVNPTSYVWTAIFGATVASVFVYGVSALGRGGPTPLKLALAGAATMVAATSLTSAVLIPRPDIAATVVSWEIGGVGGATTANLSLLVPFLLAGFAFCLITARGVNLLSLGDELAAGLGARVGLIRGAAAIGAVMLCGATTAVAGPISFVGLVVPHLCRLVAGVDYRWLLPISALTGASLLMLSDVIGRFVMPPGEVDVGIITALLGAPFFIVIVRRAKVREL
ncbi:MAG: iron ABC transporter permease [Nocardioidaceae bacterium]|nr:iron ABC transporter permease [Nocardioidaceae bacterium]